ATRNFFRSLPLGLVLCLDTKNQRSRLTSFCLLRQREIFEREPKLCERLCFNKVSATLVGLLTPVQAFMFLQKISRAPLPKLGRPVLVARDTEGFITNTSFNAVIAKPRGLGLCIWKAVVAISFFL